MGMSEFLRRFFPEYSPKLLRTHKAVAWLHPSLPFAVFLSPCGVSFFSTILSWSSRKAAAWPALPLWVPEEPFHTSFQAQPEQRSSCLRQGRCYTHRLEFTVLVSSSESSNCLPGDHQCHWFCTLFSAVA